MEDRSKELLPDNDNRITTDSTLIKVGDRYYQTKSILPQQFNVSDYNGSFTLDSGLDITDDVAYLIGDYYYLYRGKLSDVKPFADLIPGIYYDDDACKYVICEPSTEEEIAEYRYSDKITTLNADEIRNAVMNHTVVIFNMPEATHSSIPKETVDDDMLKRMIKRALLQKGIDLDQCRARFASKNMLFNFKSVLRGNNRLSMLLFDRGCEALNLRYTIIIEEAGGEVIGHPLQEPIILASDDVFSASTACDIDDSDDDEE